MLGPVPTRLAFDSLNMGWQEGRVCYGTLLGYALKYQFSRRSTVSRCK